MISKPQLDLMRADYNAHTCMGCGGPCEDEGSFCWRCGLKIAEAVKLESDPDPLAIWRGLAFWVVAIAVAWGAFEAVKWILKGKS
jgi:predicted amidophosphoribosyltransferase